MELKVTFPVPEVRGVFSIIRPTHELLVRWIDEGPDRRRGKIVVVKEFPHAGWGDSELSGRRLLRVSGFQGSSGMVIDLGKLPEHALGMIERGEIPTLLQKEIVWKKSDGG